MLAWARVALESLIGHAGTFCSCRFAGTPGVDNIKY